MPIAEHISKVFPFTVDVTKWIQSMGNTFIWRGRHEKINKKEMYNTYQDGGLNLTNVNIKCNAIFY